jgi:signal transduction histidine kinase
MVPTSAIHQISYSIDNRSVSNQTMAEISHASMLTQTDYILVVDDSPDNLFLTESILTEEGYSVVCVENGREALDAISSNPPSLVLLDVMMPDMDGYEVTRWMRQKLDLPYIPILLVTAHDRPCVVDGLDAGADDFIRKPIVEVDELLARVRSLLRLKHTIDERDHIARQREDFVSRLTHDLRTPLIAAVRMLTMINQGAFGEVPGSIKESIDTVISNNENLLAMVNTLLEVYRYDAGRKSLTISRFNICKMVDEVMKELAPLAEEKQIGLNVNCVIPPAAEKSVQGKDGAERNDGAQANPGGAHSQGTGAENTVSSANLSRRTFRIMGDRLELRRVITNIVGNAIKFTDQGFVNVDVRFETNNYLGSTSSIAAVNDGDNGDRPSGSQESSTGPEMRWVVVDVIDSGAGIIPDDQTEIFERFRQGKNKRAGSGLGLHLAHRIVEAHGGQIDVMSEPEKGSKFTIRLPVNPAILADSGDRPNR